MSELRNGEVWKQTEFPCFARVVQFIGGRDGADYMLMSLNSSRWGGVVLNAAHEVDGKYIYSRVEALEHLTQLKYTATGKDFAGNELQCQNESLAVAS